MKAFFEIWFSYTTKKYFYISCLILFKTKKNTKKINFNLLEELIILKCNLNISSHIFNNKNKNFYPGKIISKAQFKKIQY